MTVVLNPPLTWPLSWDMEKLHDDLIMVRHPNAGGGVFKLYRNGTKTKLYGKPYSVYAPTTAEVNCTLLELRCWLIAHNLLTTEDTTHEPER
jgi:hypothetical protein